MLRRGFQNFRQTIKRKKKTKEKILIHYSDSQTEIELTNGRSSLFSFQIIKVSIKSFVSHSTPNVPERKKQKKKQRMSQSSIIKKKNKKKKKKKKDLKQICP